MRVQPYASRRQNRGSGNQRAPENKEKTITRTFFCLAEREQLTVPTSRDKLVLRENGLGEKKVQIPANASKETVKDVLYKTFQPLKSCGGFELLLCEENSRTKLQVVKYGSCSTEELRCLGSGRIYIRPIQVDIFLGDVEDDEEHTEECLLCKASMPLRQMRGHMEECPGRAASSDHNIVEAEPLSAVGDGREEPSTEAATSPQAIIRQETQDNHGNLRGTDHTGAEQEVVRHVQLTTRDEIPYVEHRRKAIEDTLLTMASCEEPVAVLKEYSRNFLRGRPLDIEDENGLIEGQTTEIFVSRYNLYMDTMSELLDPLQRDLSFPLEVTFSGEEAADYGGPRKEFLGAMMRKIQEKLFVQAGEDSGEYRLAEKVEELRKNHYYGAGIIFGFSMIQGGPLPCFMEEGQLQRLLNEDSTLTEAESQFQSGLAEFGLIELIRKKPCLVFLLRKTATLPVNRSRLIKLLKPRFSEEGSNLRMREERVYRLFLNYLKEVQAGRRPEPVNIEKILKFTTGSEVEPVLGYGVSPHIAFDSLTASFFPTSNTCINRLTLATGDCVPSGNDDQSYNIFDLAFANDYFGNP